MSFATPRAPAHHARETPYIATSVVLTVLGIAAHAFGLPAVFQAQIEWLFPHDEYAQMPAWVCYLSAAVFLFAGFGTSAVTPASATRE
jgi:hypothetical protein